MKRLTALFTAAAFLLTLGIASAEEGNPWQQKESTPLLSKDKSNKKETGKKKAQKQKKQKTKKKKKEE